MAQMVSSYRSPKTEVRKSPIHGRGLFAKEPIKKGEIVAVKGGHIVDQITLKEYCGVVKNSEMQITDELYLVPLRKEEFKSVLIFINHSCKPNVGVLGTILCVAMRDIKTEEELTTDYAMHRNDRFEMKCNCGEVTCRGIIYGRDWKKKDLQKKYGKYFSAYLLEKIEQTD